MLLLQQHWMEHKKNRSLRSSLVEREHMRLCGRRYSRPAPE